MIGAVLAAALLAGPATVEDDFENGKSTLIGEVEAAIVPPSGARSLLVLVMDYDNASVSCSMADISGRTWTNTLANVNSMYDNVSGGTTTFPQNLGRIERVHITGDISTCLPDTWAVQGDAAALAIGVNVNDYDHIQYYVPASVTTSCGWSGRANVYGPRSWIRQCSLIDVVAHELGHNIFFAHGWKNGVEYGDVSTFMGGGGQGIRGVNGGNMLSHGWAVEVPHTTDATYDLPSVSVLGYRAVVTYPIPATADRIAISYKDRTSGPDAVGLRTEYLGTALHKIGPTGVYQATDLLWTLTDGTQTTLYGVTVRQNSHLLDAAEVEVCLNPPPADTIKWAGTAQMTRENPVAVRWRLEWTTDPAMVTWTSLGQTLTGPVEGYYRSVAINACGETP